MIKVLKNWQEIGEAILNLQRQGIPSHSDVRKNWDQFLLYEIIASQDRNSCIIDLGCSPFSTLNFLRAIGFKNLHGIDLDVEENQINNAPYRLYKGDITKTPFPNNFGDFAVSISVIEHGVNLEAFFQEASRILNYNGLLFLTTDYWQDKISINDAIKPLNLPWKIFDKVDIKKLIQVAQQYGFAIDNEDINIPTCSDKPIFWQGIEYTFIALVFRKKAPPIVQSAISLVKKYHDNPFDKLVLTDIRRLQKEIADYWLTIEETEIEKAYLGDIGEAHRILLNSGIKNEPLTNTEKIFVDELVSHIVRGWDSPKAIHYFLAIMLYVRADQLPLLNGITFIPQWFINNYLGFMLESPPLFREIGEAANYYQYMKKWIDYLHNQIFSNQNSKLCQEVALFFSKNANFVPLYFNAKNLKNICKKRADILEFSLKIQGHPIDYNFPERLPSRQKIRIGILAAHFQPQTDTFATLPVYKYLNRDIFEIILYTIHLGTHRLERYCSGHADAMVLLPQDLQSQVQTIREGDLDILLIGTNITAWTNAIALIALHRLARVQIANVCSCITTGMRHIDYYISGKLTEPENDAEQHYTETLIALDGSAHCYDFATEQQVISTISVTREKLGIDQNAVVYISGANFYKITPEVEAAWVKIITGTPNSRLVLYPFNPNWSSNYAFVAFEKRLMASFDQYDLSRDRLIILEAVPNVADVKERLKLGDVYLDSFPFAGATSLLDPLELSIPPVVMGGNTFRSLVGPALLKELQIPELIADNKESYIQLAIALGTNPKLRQTMSDKIKQKMYKNPAFLDSRSYSAKLGKLFQELFQNQQINTLISGLNLNKVNVIIFPNWSQPEELLALELASVIRAVLTHPDRSDITLLIDTSNIAEEEANLAIASVVMNLIMEEDLEVADQPEISLIGQLNTMQWEALLTHIHSRIVLKNENQQAIVEARAEILPYLEIDSLSNMRTEQFFFT